MAEYQQRRDFVSNHLLFGGWAPKFKRLLEMSLVKRTYSFDTVICKQGQQCDGLYFIVK